MRYRSNFMQGTDLRDEFEAAIAILPDIHILSSRDDVLIGDRQIDRLLTVEIAGQEIGLVIDEKAAGYPRDVRNAAHQLNAVRTTSSPYPLVPVMVAPAISETGRQWLRANGIGYWDSGGTLFLQLPSALFWIDRPVPSTGLRRLRSLYAGASTQVLHTLLVESDRVWHVRDLATCAGVSQSTAHQVLVALEEQLWVEKQGRGPATVRTLREPGNLLDAWAARHTLDTYRHHRFHRWTRRSSDLVGSVSSVLTDLEIDYALTLGSGAHLIAPFATEPGRLTLLLPASANIAEVARQLDLKPVDEGENVVFLESQLPTPLMFRQRVDDVWVASDIQLYLDLWAWPQRGKEQAQHLRRERLGY